MENNEFHSGFVAIVGRPNVGKSTFMNRVLGQRIAITSSKAQTTRNKISGVFTDKEKQIVFLDTPGIHKPKNKLDDYMDRAAMSTFKEVDLILFMTEAGQSAGPGDNYILEQLREINKPVFLVLNKIDLIHPDEMMSQIEEYRQIIDFKEVFPISATTGNNVDELLAGIGSELEVGPMYYPEDQITDHPEYFIVAELIRENILHETHDEIPHSVAVVVERMNTRVNGKLQVEANIYVEREGQKGIIIGQKGSMLKHIGIGARRKIEDLLGEKVNLKLWVKVKKNWRDNPSFLTSAGYSAQDLK